MVEERDSPVIEANKSDFPLDVVGPSLYFFPDSSCKNGKGKKYDKLRWGQGSNYMGITKTKCDPIGACLAVRLTWLCHGKCKSNMTADERCCSLKQKKSPGSECCLFVKYAGHHTCKASQLKEQQDIIDDELTFVERVQKWNKSAVVVSSIPDQLVGDEVFIVECNEQNPGERLQTWINDGRTYERAPTTNQTISTLFSDHRKVDILNFSCKGSYVCNNVKENCKFYSRFHVVHQVPAGNGKCMSCFKDLYPLTCGARKTVAYQHNNPGETNNFILVMYKGVHCCLARFKLQETTRMELVDYFRKSLHATINSVFPHLTKKTGG